ncbi:MAG: IS66 family insertion sequence element accessory protein TnpB [Roseomonas sp.]|nr:IS66 family insertion sequence element accessory protein TnpB [Roseomonas sp.]
MIGPAAGTRIFLACGQTDMRRGMDGLAALVQQAFGQDELNRPGFAGGSNFQIGWSRYEQDD